MKRPARVAFGFLIVVIAAAATLSQLSIHNADLGAAEPTPAKEHSILMLVQNPKQIAVVLDSCRQLTASPDYHVARTKVIVCGPAAEALVNDSPAMEAIAQAVQAKVQIEVCGISLKKQEISADQLAPGVTVVENGIISAVEAKTSGWISVDL